MDDSHIGARTAIRPVLAAAIAALLDYQKVRQNVVGRVGQICDSAGVSEPAATGRFVRPPEEWPEYRNWLRAQQKELRGRPLSASAAECPGDASDQPDETVIMKPGDWRTKVDELTDCFRRHGLDGAADEIVRHLPPTLTALERACEKRDMGELAFSRREGADEREAVAWLLKYLKEIQGELATEGGQKTPKSITKDEAEGKFPWTPPLLEGYVRDLLREVEYPSERKAVAWIADKSRKPEPARATLRKTYYWQNRPQKTPKPRTTNEAQSGVSPAQNADAAVPHEEVTDAVLDIEEKLRRQLVDDEREAVAWTLQQAGADEEERGEAIRQLIQSFRSGDM